MAQNLVVVRNIWTQEAGTEHFGSTYLIKALEHLEAYKAMHIPHLASIGIEIVSDHVFDVRE